MTSAMYIASFAWFLIVFGYTRRKNLFQHIPLVLAGICCDILLVLYLQFTREAVQEALEFDRSVYEQIHIWTSTVALLLYFPVIYFGSSLKKDLDNPELRVKHRRVALTALTFRTIGFLFMFSMWES